MSKLLTTTLAIIGFFVIGLVSCTVAADANQDEIERRIKEVNDLLTQFDLELDDQDSLRTSITKDVINPKPEGLERGLIEGLTDYDLEDLNVACELARVFIELPTSLELWAADKHVALGLSIIVGNIIDSLPAGALESSMLACETVEKTIKNNAKQ